MRWLASKLLRQPQRSGARSTFTLWATGPTMRVSSSSSPRMTTRTMPVARLHSRGPQSRGGVPAAFAESAAPISRCFTHAPPSRCFPVPSAAFPDDYRLASGGNGQTRSDVYGGLCRLSRVGFVPNLLVHHDPDL